MARATQRAKSDQPLSAMDSIENLVDRIGKGEVVFFVGAGFSLDSEGNSANRLMRRLLWRLQAMSLVLESTIREQIPDSGTKVTKRKRLIADAMSERRSLVLSLLESMKRTFNLRFESRFEPDVAELQFWWPDSDVMKIAEKYYESNDWFCATFEKLLEIGYEICDRIGSNDAKRSKLLDEMISKIAEVEDRIYARSDSSSNGDNESRQYGPFPFEPIDVVPLCPIAPCLFAWSESRSLDRQRDAGKSLFLDTMGFADEAIMGGQPAGSELRTVEQSFRQRLFPRHHVLARLAREGLCPVVLTTNYDLLLEGAWRLSGFELEQRSEKSTRSSLYREALPHSPLKHMAVVTSPVEFVESGKANRTSLVVKVHGCVGTYRQGRKEPARLPSKLFYDNRRALVKRLSDVAEWEENLRTMVFTYREIQNWRKDSWARDYLATTQRTRSVAFVGYALQDPVIHDAFRTVYEEMAEDQKRVSESRAEASIGQASLKSRVQAATKQPQEAPAFFFGGASDQSFHATEVLQAATWAAGGSSSSPHEHANYLRFSYLNQDDQFPNLDDLFLWTYHRTMRKRQLQMLTDELRPVAATLLRGQKILPLPSTLERIEDRFRQVIDAELKCSEKWFAEEPGGSQTKLSDREKNVQRLKCSQHRRQLQKLVAWTWDFHPALWKEFALADVANQPGVNLPTVSNLRAADWYQPAAAAPGRVAWGVVVELAIRWLLGSTAGLNSDECLETRGEFEPVPGAAPAVNFYHERRPMIGTARRGALPDGLRLTGEPFQVQPDAELDWSCGVWHEWRLPTDG
jgi:hypothetical protein